MNYVCEYASPIGLLHLVSDGEALIELWIEGQKYAAKSGPDGVRKADLPVFECTRQWLDQYFDGQIPLDPPPIRLIGTPFQQLVWRILQQIPYGKTVTYGDVARRIATVRGVLTLSAQAVGGAVGRNPVSIIIPCHRVIGANGRLTGYAGGIDKKFALLRLEHAAIVSDRDLFGENKPLGGRKGVEKNLK
ncbi:methylated-DNA--[protein]-cysteine S-methyltransferase [Hoylesella enoeca]|uniref:methylated-DNA--[protein]-cysteine S-methyltransferase n=1 Tax=Hoylesella enoeca TaxID=76123 RepID=UPI000469CA2D|nr:methylated-DNA--[protein]-cysteine S-methyltransferase [Hoylesella enoeca]